MILTGISDEAGHSIDRQIEAHRRLGWNALELRCVNELNAAGDLPDAQFDEAAGKIEDAGFQVTCFASAIGNWSRNIKDDFAVDRRELETAIPRMKRLGARFMRTMSWVGKGATEEEWRDETIRRYKELARIAEDGDVILAHENCTGWAGESAENMLRLLDEVGGEHLTLIYDTGNTVGHGFEPWSFYRTVKERIAYVHVKDAARKADPAEATNYRYVGEGDAMVYETLKDFLSTTDYDGVISIEPHVAKLVHRADIVPNEEQMFESYLEYGRKFIALVEKVLKDIGR